MSQEQREQFINKVEYYDTLIGGKEELAKEIQKCHYMKVKVGEEVRVA